MAHLIRQTLNPICPQGADRWCHGKPQSDNELGPNWAKILPQSSALHSSTLTPISLLYSFLITCKSLRLQVYSRIRLKVFELQVSKKSTVLFALNCGEAQTPQRARETQTSGFWHSTSERKQDFMKLLYTLNQIIVKEEDNLAIYSLHTVHNFQCQLYVYLSFFSASIEAFPHKAGAPAL